jgi:phosphoglycerol transferase MdoB-like AlkP superfamily enzyme
VAITELMREMATLIMLVTIGMVAGKTKHERFAYFIYSFAIWDIFYYAFLYLIIGWPMSLMDWDILFLLPMMWTGPVWAPLLLSAFMIILAICILIFSNHHQNAHLKLKEWVLLVSGSIVVIIAFCKDFYVSITTLYPLIPATKLFFSKQTGEYAEKYVPKSFDIAVFTIGSVLISAGISIYVLRNRREIKNNKRV